MSPYIRGFQRDKYTEAIAKILQELPTDIEGVVTHFDYIINKLGVELLFGKKGGRKVNFYKRWAIVHAIEAAADELKRHHLDPHAKERIVTNGDIEYEDLAGKYRLKEDEEPSPGKDQGVVSTEGS